MSAQLASAGLVVDRVDRDPGGRGPAAEPAQVQRHARAVAQEREAGPDERSPRPDGVDVAPTSQRHGPVRSTNQSRTVADRARRTFAASNRTAVGAVDRPERKPGEQVATSP